MYTVSVAMPTYNQEDYIEQAIKGVLMQQKVIFELVIANDGSSDKTITICEQYAKLFPSQIKLINQPCNQGLIKNTWTCLLACTGKYIAICEGDDYWIDPLKLYKQIEILEKDQTISMVHTNWNNYHQNQNKIKKNACKHLSNICEKESGILSVEAILKNEYSVRFSSICFRKSTLLNIYQKDPNLFNSFYSTLDLPLFLDFANEGRFSFINESMVVYRITGNSVSISTDIQSKVSFIKGCLHIYIRYTQKYNLSNKLQYHLIRLCLQTLYPYAFRYKDYCLATELKQIVKQTGYKLRVGEYICHIGSHNPLIHFLFSKIISKKSNI